MPVKMYPLGDRHPKQKNYFDESIKAIKSNEYREPKKGEWYFSGAIVTAYKAPNDLNTKYHIATIVKVKTITTYEMEIL